MPLGSTVNPPSLDRFRELYRHATSKGLIHEAAYAYATLGWWGEHYGLRTPAIHSGYRSPQHQRSLQARWDRGDRAGLVVRPADSSPHTRRVGWDVERCEHLWIYGAWAPYLRVRWGGNFQGQHKGDVVHFDLEGR